MYASTIITNTQGYDRVTSEKQRLEKIISKLTVDSSFEIFTRAGLEYNMRGEYNCLFIDFKDISILNSTYGYNHVNKLICEIFKRFTLRHVLIGRLFSGDEIVILSKTLGIALLQTEFAKAVDGKIKYREQQVYNIKTLLEIEKRLNLRSDG